MVVIDDHAMLLDSLVRNLDREPDITVVASAATIAEGLVAMGRDIPDIVVIDDQLPDGDGAIATRQITEQSPSVRVIMLTGSNDDGAVFEAHRRD